MTHEKEEKSVKVVKHCYYFTFTHIQNITQPQVSATPTRSPSRVPSRVVRNCIFSFCPASLANGDSEKKSISFFLFIRFLLLFIFALFCFRIFPSFRFFTFSGILNIDLLSINI